MDTAFPSVILEPLRHGDSDAVRLSVDEVNNEYLRDSGHDSSGPDEAIFDELYADVASSSGTSHDSEDDLSELLESRRASCVSRVGEEIGPLTPTKQRSPFRHPSSVRAIQLDTTPPHLRSSAHHRRYRMSNASRNSTPRSVRSFQDAIRSSRSSPSKSEKREYPLVLLHVTLLPVSCPYPQEAMEAILPPYVIENWKLLNEKVTATVLDRGILVPHPREDYELLEERLLESLELKAPRILQCGHFRLTPQEEADIEASDDEFEGDGDDDMCQDCGRRMRDGRFGTGAGHQRWSIKVYASNGLMRAGAWAAAWSEMERVDVEVLPWLDDEMRRQLELHREDGNQMNSRNQNFPDVHETMAEERRREIYGDSHASTSNNFQRDGCMNSNDSALSRSAEVPLSALLFNYVQYLLQDRRNVVIGVLSLCVLNFALKMGAQGSPSMPSIASQSDTASLPMAIERALGGSEPLSLDVVSSLPIAPIEVLEQLEQAAEDFNIDVETAGPDTENIRSSSKHWTRDTDNSEESIAETGYTEHVDTGT